MRGELLSQIHSLSSLEPPLSTKESGIRASLMVLARITTQMVDILKGHSLMVCLMVLEGLSIPMETITKDKLDLGEETEREPIAQILQYSTGCLRIMYCMERESRRDRAITSRVNMSMELRRKDSLNMKEMFIKDRSKTIILKARDSSSLSRAGMKGYFIMGFNTDTDSSFGKMEASIEVTIGEDLKMEMDSTSMLKIIVYVEEFGRKESCKEMESTLSREVIKVELFGNKEKFQL